MELRRLDIAFWVDDGALHLVETHCHRSIEGVGDRLGRISDRLFDVS